jgi:hypothetical protein
LGRGRQKAKHTKVARELKYYSPETDYNALEAELKSANDDDSEEFVDRWADSVEKATSYDDEREVDLDEDR